MRRAELSILFLGKRGEPTCERAARYLSLHAPATQVHFGRRGDPFPPAEAVSRWDFIVSYLSPWIVPKGLLERAQQAAINFHTGPPEYPGIGCTNFALYEGATRYGVTCHRMEPAPDTGPIIRADYFPVHEQETVLSLTDRCYAHLARLFYEIADLLLTGEPLPVSDLKWARPPFRRAELEDLCRLRADMSPEEIQRRIRATTFPGYPSASFEPAEKEVAR
ncbi:MAG: hypothetical protein HYZ93_02070 [Candidatus Omnitrophica bacterium]|nr:hypothetical protein [Candidatus Omnitrophota bacterium]